MNSVPAAAVIRGGQALFVMTGRKGHVGCSLSNPRGRTSRALLVPYPGLPWVHHGWRVDWSKQEESGISGVEVKFADTRRNTKGAGNSLVLY